MIEELLAIKARCGGDIEVGVFDGNHGTVNNDFEIYTDDSEGITTVQINEC